MIDYSGEDGPFSPAQVERMKQKPDGSRRIVLSYMSIGEAEDLPLVLVAAFGVLARAPKTRSGAETTA